MNYIKRLLDPVQYRAPAFLFGPRMTGKTTLLRQLKVQAFFDLLDTRQELEYRAAPERFFEQISALPEGALIVIDEIQRAPELLNYVQMGIDRFNQIFILSGSSARKLRRGGANLLGGRALDLKLHPFTCAEMRDHFDLETALGFGTLPKIATLLMDGQKELARAMLSGYVTTYLKEEIQVEALTRNLGAFQRFLTIAAQSNGQVIEYANISRDCAVPASTVKEYYQILEDTLIGFFLWPDGHNERKKSRPKSYFFDCGVIRALQNRLQDPPTPRERGFLFETWLVNELRRIRDYQSKPHTFHFWRERDHEIDILVRTADGVPLAIECKSGATEIKQATSDHFKKRYPDTRLIVASMVDTRKRVTNGIEVVPWQEALEIYNGI